MRNTGLEETQAGIKIAGRNINNLRYANAATAKSLQSCPTLCDPIDGSPPGYPVPGILQARTLEWVAISFSNAWKWKVKLKSLSRVWLLATPWTAAYQGPPSIGFSRQEYWSGVSLPSPICRWHHPYGRKWRGTKNLLMKVKVESEKAGLKLNIQKMFMASSPIISWEMDGGTVETVSDFISGLQNHYRWWLQR